MNLHFLTRSAMHHELRLLLAIHNRNGLPLPVTPAELPAGVLEAVPLSRLLDDGTLSKINDANGPSIVLTAQGLQHLRRLVIDYHLELMDLRRVSDKFIVDRVSMLLNRGCRRIVLYGASDTARVLLEYLRGEAIEVVAVIDDDPKKHGILIGSVPVISPSETPGYDFDSIVVTTVAFQDQILLGRKALAYGGRRMIGLFDDWSALED